MLNTPKSPKKTGDPKSWFQEAVAGEHLAADARGLLQLRGSSQGSLRVLCVRNAAKSGQGVLLCAPISVTNEQ